MHDSPHPCAIFAMTPTSAAPIANAAPHGGHAAKDNPNIAGFSAAALAILKPPATAPATSDPVLFAVLSPRLNELLMLLICACVTSPSPRVDKPQGFLAIGATGAYAGYATLTYFAPSLRAI